LFFAAGKTGRSAHPPFLGICACAPGGACAILPSSCSPALLAQRCRIWREAIVAQNIHVKACALTGAIQGASVHWGKVCPGGSHSSAGPRQRLGGLKRIGRTKFCHKDLQLKVGEIAFAIMFVVQPRSYTNEQPTLRKPRADSEALKLSRVSRCPIFKAKGLKLICFLNLP
jgi:hypothetical protein